MDHNLDESLTLDTMESTNTVGGDEVVLDAGGEDVQMEFEQIVEQPMFMDAETQEIIVPDFVDEQFSLQEYSIQDESQNIASNFAETTLDTTENQIEFEKPTVPVSTTKPKVISVKLQAKQRQVVATKLAPRQVAIAPKPPKLVSSAFGVNKQFVITQKHVVVPNKDSLVKKPISGVIQASGSNFVSVMPKLKFVSSAAGQNMQYAQIIKQPSNTMNKQGVTRLVIQGQNVRDQPAVITKVVSQPTRVLTMQQKTVPVSLSKVTESPSKTQNKIKLAKVQQISVKSPKYTPTNSGVGYALTKKIVVSSHQPIAAKQVVTLTKDKEEAGTVRVHPINVPGKGIQYIQVMTKPPAPAVSKPVVVIADGNYKGMGIKNKIIQVGDKVISGPPPLVYTGSSSTSVNTLTGKPQKKLVRIAPLGSKTAQAFLQKARSSQSLLAPMSPVTKTPAVTETTTSQGLLTSFKLEKPEPKVEKTQEIDSSEALRMLVANTVGEDITKVPKHKIEIEYDDVEETVVEEMADHDYNTSQDYEASQDYDNSQNYETTQDYTMEQDFSVEQEYNTSQEPAGRNTPLIVIPSTFVKRVDQEPLLEEMPVHVRIDNYSDSEVPTTDLASRPRKACNCTKSQCLKLYCDCFANGEFCNKCNCINCHNNLANEELRQKAIRGCLDRNPNAFRPKIGKAKGGIDIIRRHNKGCNCKRSGCLKNYCECFEAKIACSAMCKCVGCRNVEDAAPRRHHMYRAPAPAPRQPCSFMTNEVIEAVCQCLIAAAKESDNPTEVSPVTPHDPIRNVIEEFSRCLQDIIGAAHHPEPQTSILDEVIG